MPEYDPEVHPLAQPALDFACPESALCLAHTPYSDMYSLAALVYAVFTKGGTVFNCAADWYAYKKAMNEVRDGESYGGLSSAAVGIVVSEPLV